MGTQNAVLGQERLLVSDEKSRERRRPLVENIGMTVDGKSIVTLQFCMSCSRTFALQRGRKRCPSCKDLLRSRTLVIRLRDPR